MTLSLMIPNLLRAIVPENLRPSGYLTQLVRDRTGLRVIQGPFKGLNYVSRSIGSVYISKLLGIYERELSACVEEICAAQPRLIVDVGTAEGYYAVGFAIRNPAAHVIGFEVDSAGRDSLQEMAENNHVSDRLHIHGKCDPGDLSQAISEEDHPVIICDVEGDEEKLMDPTAIPALRGATILVELHDFLVPGVSELLISRFERSHHIEHILQEPRFCSDFPYCTFYTKLLPRRYIEWAVSEMRPAPMAWLYMLPRQAG